MAVLTSMQEYEIREQMKLERLRHEVRKGLDQLDDGQSTDGRTFMKSLVAKSE